MDRYICIHGHFYQPPRENPWLEEIEPQDSAYPFDNWNERVSAECYEPNLSARILDEKGRIRQITNNYSRISFNFGPTLLLWMERKAPEVYAGILEADRLSAERFGGHGSAIAMPFNHMIMPLANSRDKITQVRWGIRDFVQRFGRRPEGMWLPETAVDLETLLVMAAEGIRFTILAPGQARRVRRAHMPAWRDVSGGIIDPSEAYRLSLGTNAAISIYFYDGPISNAVAFEHLLRRGEDMVARLTGAFANYGGGPRLVTIATDGESYGHHHRFGEMALAYALQKIEHDGEARLTNYAEFLGIRPPTLEVELIENTSWSCAHGVDRWQKDCGCSTGTHPEWKQAWRAPMRRAMDELRDAVTPRFEAMLASFAAEPWALRDAYIDVVLDPSDDTINRFLKDWAPTAAEADQERVLELLELQRHLMYMYTSCGWFFDDLAGIEAIQCLQYAARAVQLAEHLFQEPFEAPFLKTLQEARSNNPDRGDGSNVYEEFVRPARVDLHRVGAHFVVWSLFEPGVSHRRIYAYELGLNDYRRFEDGTTRFVIGSGELQSRVTREKATLAFAAFYFGGHNLSAAVRDFPGEENMKDLCRRSEDAFNRGDYAGLIRLLDDELACCTFSLESLFRSERKKVIEQILRSTLVEAEHALRQIYERNAQFMRFLADIRMPPPRAFRLASEYVLNADLQSAFSQDELNPAVISRLLEEARREKIDLKSDGLAQCLENSLRRSVVRFRDGGHELERLRRFRVDVILARAVPFPFDFSRVQNIFYRMIDGPYADFRKKAEIPDPEAQLWVQLFREIGEDLSVRVD